jgi:CheY-like chemotaxis protein/HPt (histidine-containing phosphotransfer) domain-containing protein
VDVIECRVEDILAIVESTMRPAAIEQGLEFKIVRNEPIADIIRTDPARLKQCIINLISNAIKFTEKGYVRLNVLCQQQKGKDVILFDVEDSGVGIAPDKLWHIFEPFAQADVSTTHVYGGTGLGLAITRNLAELLGGNITVRSIKDKGSVFSLSIPTGVESGQAAGATVSSDKKENSQLSTQDIDNIKLSGRVLVAEDSPTNQMLIELLLRRMGVESVIVENGKLAVEKAGDGRFDLILMDIMMPVMNGFEATRQLRRNGIKMPIVALTACAMKGDEKKCLAAGCSDYLTKPVDKKKLTQTLAKYLSAEGMKKTSMVVASTADTTVAKQDVGEKTSQAVLPDDGGEMEINFHLLLERIGDESLIDEIIPVFLKDNAERMEMLSQAIAKNDSKEIKFYAHSVKGAAATIGAVKISELAKQLETAARDSQQADYKAVFDEICSRFNRLKTFLGRSDWKQAAQQSQQPQQQ